MRAFLDRRLLMTLAAGEDEARLWSVLYPAGLRETPRTHAEHSLSLLLSGAVSETVGSRSMIGQAGYLIVKPAGTTHCTAYSNANARMLTLRFPDSTLRRMGASIGDWRLLYGATAGRAVLRLLSAADNEVDFEQLLADLLVLLSPAESPAAQPTWLRRVVDRMHELAPAHEPVSILAREGGVHSVHLARVFRRCFGVSLTEYRRYLRVLAAGDCLFQPADSLASAAQACGYSDQSHMGRELRKFTGLSPTAVRAMAARNV